MTYYLKGWLLALPLTLAACAGVGGGGETSGDVTLGLSADPVQGEVPLTVHFTAVAEPAPNDLSYRWNFGAGEPSAGSKSRPHVYTEPGTYTASVELSQGGVSARDEVEVVVAESSRPPEINNLPPEVRLTATPDPAAPDTVTFQVTAEDPNGDPLGYVVDFGDGGRAVGASVSHTYAAPGTYLATAVVSDDRDGVATAEAEVTLE